MQKTYYNVSDSTLRKWAREKLIRTETTKGGHWRYWIEDKSQQSNTPQNEQSSNYIIYTRVSSKKQSRNLDKQSIFLKSKFPNYTLITDIGS
jgi:predicted site-specific integrase-resolvase